jgi:hypothetical protein
MTSLKGLLNLRLNISTNFISEEITEDPKNIKSLKMFDV